VVGDRRGDARDLDPRLKQAVVLDRRLLRRRGRDGDRREEQDGAGDEHAHAAMVTPFDSARLTLASLRRAEPRDPQAR
jgi:hypothetical protein